MQKTIIAALTTIYFALVNAGGQPTPRQTSPQLFEKTKEVSHKPKEQKHRLTQELMRLRSRNQSEEIFFGSHLQYMSKK